jgi:hypothetical protein
MTVIDDVELGQRLRALRVDPPANGFEALLAQRLVEAGPELKAEPPAPAPRMGRVLVGPWLRRHPVRLVGAAALLLAGAAAAVEGGVVEWVQLRVATRAVDAPAPGPAEHARSRNTPRAERSHAERAPQPRAAPALEAAPPAEAPSSAQAVADAAPTSAGAAPDGSRAFGDPTRAPARKPFDREGAARASARERERRAGASLATGRAAERRSGPELPVVPRLAIEPRPLERMEHVDRVDLARARGSDAAGREPGRDLERIRAIARARRERSPGAERPRMIERLRERREHNETDRERSEGRGNPSERGRREHSGR